MQDSVYEEYSLQLTYAPNWQDTLGCIRIMKDRGEAMRFVEYSFETPILYSLQLFQFEDASIISGQTQILEMRVDASIIKL